MILAPSPFSELRCTTIVHSLSFDAVVAEVVNQMTQEAQALAVSAASRAKGMRPKVDDFLTIALQSNLGREATNIGQGRGILS